MTHHANQPGHAPVSEIRPATQPLVDMVIKGKGMTAQLAALALTHAGWSVSTDPQADTARLPLEGMPEGRAFQSVLALGPSTVVFLENLGVKLPQSQAVTAMWLDDAPRSRPAYILAADASSDTSPDMSSDTSPDTSEDMQKLDPAILDMRPGSPSNVLQEQAPLAHIVCRQALAEAIAHAFEKAALTQPSQLLDERATDLNAEHLDVERLDVERLKVKDLDVKDKSAASPRSIRIIDCRPPRPPLFACVSGDYQADALICRLRFSQPHQGDARQIFLPSGPLALLPLPDPHDRALIWSLPRRRAQAMRSVASDLFLASLSAVLSDYAPCGTLEEAGPRETQSLAYYLADVFADGQLIRLGDAAHRIHPMAGQGFNLNCRDIAGLIDALTISRRTGLGAGDPGLAERYNCARRADAATLFGLTHGLYHFAPRATGLFSMARRLSSYVPALNDFLIQQAQSGGHPAPRLMQTGSQDQIAEI